MSSTTTSPLILTTRLRSLTIIAGGRPTTPHLGRHGVCVLVCFEVKAMGHFQTMRHWIDCPLTSHRVCLAADRSAAEGRPIRWENWIE